MKVMIFTIFRDFSRFNFRFKTFKLIKNDKKGVNFCAGPTWVRRGTGAMWQSHAGPRECLRGTEVTRGCYLYLIYI